MTFALKADPTLDELVAHSVALLREHEPAGGYYGCDSGGKDSRLIRVLAREARVSVSWHYNVTTIDPPELFRFLKEYSPDTEHHRSPYGSLIRRAEVKGIPTRRSRWCCDEFKESKNPRGARLLLGIRADESDRRRKAWAEVKMHRRTRELAILPAFEWATDELWTFLRQIDEPVCELYAEGWHRLGCVGCPMARDRGRHEEFKRWPAIGRRWRLAFDRLWERRVEEQGQAWKWARVFRDVDEAWSWWLSDRAMPDENQLRLDL